MKISFLKHNILLNPFLKLTKSNQNQTIHIYYFHSTSLHPYYSLFYILYTLNHCEVPKLSNQLHNQLKNASSTVLKLPHIVIYKNLIKRDGR